MSTINPLPPVNYTHVLGIDCYHGDDDIQMHALLAAGIQFLYVKASQGRGYVDPAYADNAARSRSVGILTGAYHFFDPSTDPKQQAAHFLSVAPVVKGDLVHCLDSETTGEFVGQDTFICAQEMKRLTGRWPCIYSSDSMFSDYLKAHFSPPENYFIWIARYGHSPVNGYNAWQYSQSGQVEGVPHALDLNVFEGDLDALKAHTY